MRKESVSGLKGVIAKLERRGLVERVKKEVSIRYELSRVISAYEGRKAVIIEKAVGGKDEEMLSIVAGVCSSENLLEEALGEDPREKLLLAIERPGEFKYVDEKGPYQLMYRGEPVDEIIPIPRHYPEEGGPYITSGIFIVKDEEEGRFNASYHRMMYLGENRFSVRVVGGRDLYRLLRRSEEAGEELKATVAIGSHPSLMLAASTSAGTLDELKIAAGMTGEVLRLVKCRLSDIYVPADVEIVLEGRFIPGEREREGPFVEILGVDRVRKQPVFEVELVSMRKRAFYYDILPGGKEHALLMGLPAEVNILREVKKRVQVKEVRLTEAGSRWIEAVISITKTHNSDPMTAALAAVFAHPSLKRVIVVDEDVNVDDYVEVQRAILTNAYPPLDYKILSGVKGSSLIHDNLRRFKVEGKEVTAELPKVVLLIDATKKLK